MTRTKHLAGWGRTTFWMMASVSLLLWVTGVVMFVLPVSELMDMSPTQVAWRHQAGVIHGVCTWLFCVLCGRGVWPHVRVMWHKQRDRRQWGLGLFNLTIFCAIGITGLTLLYGNPDLHEGASPWHFWIGALSVVVFLAHTWRRFIPAKPEPI